MADPGTQSRIPGSILAGVFVVALCSVPVLQMLGYKDFDLVEKRPLAARPKWPSSMEEWAKFPGAVDDYFNDHFSLRSELISTSSYLHYRMGLSSYSKILVGLDGWLFFVGDPDFKFVRGLNHLSHEQIDGWLQRMEDRQRWLADRGARFLILPAPVKETIYHEHLPEWLQREAHPTFVDQLVQAADGRLAIIDVRKLVLARKAQIPVYGPFDSHWNVEGSFVAYNAVMERLQDPRIRALKRESVTFYPAPQERVNRDLALMLGIHPFLKIEQVEYRPKSTPQIEYLTSRTDPNSPRMIRTGIPNTPTLMLVGDSYSMELLPYFEDTFGAILWRHVQDGSFPQADMERYHPDIVLLEVQEAGLGAM